MKHFIKSVDAGSPADEAGIVGGSYLIALNGEAVVDIIDYEQLTCSENVVAEFELPNGEFVIADIEKDMYTPLGLNFESSLMSPVRQCKNHCIFCFIDQMHTGGRKTLHFKDDDWRLSLIMGNYVTLTNVDEAEFNRIIKRRVSPLYISVHATDGEVRKTMMRNPSADLIMQRLSRLKSEKLSFHSQIVLCPEINDGAILEKTIRDLYSLQPSAQSVAVVPVGLTKYREGLYPLRCMTKDEAITTIGLIEKMQEQFLNDSGTRFVFASDEMYIKAELPLPQEECYEDYPQLENGVGLLRKFEFEFMSVLEDSEKEFKNKLKHKQFTIHGVTGTSAYDFLCGLFAQLKPLGINYILHPIENDFFGHTVTVSGLVCAEDIINQLSDESIEYLVLPHTMMRENTTVFLDSKTVNDIEQALHCKAFPIPCYDGGEFLCKLIDIIGEQIRSDNTI